jgi:hypothetical protein
VTLSFLLNCLYFLKSIIYILSSAKFLRRFNSLSNSLFSRTVSQRSQTLYLSQSFNDIYALTWLHVLHTVLAHLLQFMATEIPNSFKSSPQSSQSKSIFYLRTFILVKSKCSGKPNSKSTKSFSLCSAIRSVERSIVSALNFKSYSFLDFCHPFDSNIWDRISSIYCFFVLRFFFWDLFRLSSEDESW